MSKLTHTKEYIDPMTNKKVYYVFASFETGDIEPMKKCTTWEEKVEFEQKLFGLIEKQSNENRKDN